ncbi:CDP-alcohol phosphatidyltransferase family protein [Micromonospora sp. SL4-19]|uniref:CDP-alcohol phosphatidyltransferase family protein n=1 Tax=Micromonospora sp. SL4-19 TaxID=3399129 RepID=UPI003A4D9AAE
MSTVRTGPLAGLIVGFVLLAGLAGTVGIGVSGWLAGLAYGVVLHGLLRRGRRAAGADRLGPADRVTLVRALLVGGVLALVVSAWGGPAPVAVLVPLTAVALALDAVDGWVARRTGTASPLGARFDMEVDAFLILVLSVHLAPSVGGWVLAIGGTRYAFVAAGWPLPWLRGPLPPRYWRKVVAAAQGVVLAVAASEALPPAATTALVVGALALLVESFGRDVVWLWRHRLATTTPTIRPARAAAGPADPKTPPETITAPGRATPSDETTLPSPGRRIRAGAFTGVAALLVVAALVVPNQLARIGPGVFLRLPVEGLVAVALLLVVPARARRPLAVLLGLALGLLTLLTLLDMGFFVARDRPFDVLLDWGLLDDGFAFLADSIGRAGAVAAAVGALLLAAGLPVLATAAVLRLTRLVARHHTATVRVVAALSVLWLGCAVAGLRLAAGVPVAGREASSLVASHVGQVRAGLRDRSAFAAEVAADAYRDVPGDRLLTGLRGRDVLVAFVESYGRDAVEDPGLAPGVGAVLDDGYRRLRAAGYDARSGFLTSPTFGGGSWLAHATLLSGVWIDNDRRHRDLLTGNRLTLGGAFQRAGWQTVGVLPAATKPWPEGRFYGYDRYYDAEKLAYRGPAFGYAPMPDQYTLATFQRLERARPHAPLMAEIPLVSSHSPWSAIPKPVPWDAIGDGSIYHRPANRFEDGVPRGSARVRADYRHSIEYTLGTLVSYVLTYGGDDLVLVFLGDHQPAAPVTGVGAGRDVPITIVAKDPAVLRRVAGWGWQDGLRPGPRAPVWRMDALRDRFLTAFGPEAGH